MTDLLNIHDLSVTFHTPYGRICAVRNVDLTVAYGETVALVGESGSGKSVTALSTIGLLPQENCTVTGSIQFDGEEMLGLSEHDLRTIRGGSIGMIFQDPMTSLNPTMRVGNQILEGILRHIPLPRAEARQLAIESLQQVGIPDPAERFKQFPHQFSGGQRQRIVIAMMLACRPRLIIADEPTTALDVTIQAQILDLLKEVQQMSGASVLLITHDLGVVANMADRVVVMYAGQVVERAPVEELFASPQHPYTQALLRSVPQMGPDKSPLYTIPGAPPSLSQEIVGCPFAPRCPYAMNICTEQTPHPCWLNDPRAAFQRQKFEKAQS